MSDIFNLKSSIVFHFFEQISKIPRPSFNEKEISEYLINFAKERNLEVSVDSVYNVVIKKPATVGYENAPVVAIQAHTDMVCEKNKGVEHDFFKDPIKLIYEGDFIKADRTTLGADNGIAVAMALSVLDLSDIAHPAIEAIFTSSEEAGMEGARYLDTSNLKSSIFLNIDSEEEGVFTVGCAGGVKVDIELPARYMETDKNFESYCFRVYGLMGGHSGVDINKNRANSNILLARALNILDKNITYSLNKIDGGAKDNAIPREAEAILSINHNDFEKLQNQIKEIEAIYKNEYSNTDTNIKLEIEKIERQIKSLDNNTKKSIITSLMVLPNGPQTMSTDIDGLVESSLNIGVVKTIQDKIEITSAIRSSVSTKKELIIQILELAINNIGGKMSLRGDYPAWEYNKNSVIRDKCISVYKEMYGEEPKIELIHAGLECGLFSEKMPNADLVSFGPNLYDIHTPNERASISSIDRTWDFLLNVLKEVK